MMPDLSRDQPGVRSPAPIVVKVNKRKRARLGFTLVELIASLIASSVLMIGLSSSVFIAMKAIDNSNAPTTPTIVGNAALTDMRADMEFATSFSEKAVTATTFTVPDRNGDASPETIRYAWSGIPGDPLTRQCNGGVVANLVEDVHNFGLNYVEPSGAVEVVTVQVRVTSDSLAEIETSFPVLNRP